MKKNVKMLLCVMLAAATAFSLASCGGGNSSSSSGSSGTGSETASTGSSSNSEEASVEESDAGRNEDPIEVSMLLVSSGNSTDKEEEVTDSINEILSAELNTTVTFTTVPTTDHSQKVNLMLASGDPLDLFQSFTSYASFLDNGYMMDISDYAEYYSDVTELVGDYMASGQVNGRQYGLPSLKDLASDSCYVFRTDILEDCGIDVSTFSGFEDMYEILTAIKEKYPDMTPMMGGSAGAPMKCDGDMDTQNYYDGLGDSLGVAVLMHPVSDTTVENYYETESFEKLCQYAWDWKQEGLIGWDSLTPSADICRAGLSAGYAYAYSPKAVAEASTNAGYEMTSIRMMPEASSLLTTSNAWSWCVNSNCENPERALEMLNYMYTSAEIENLLAWGIEGEDYQVVSDEGSGVIDYVDGQDSGTVAYYQWTKYSFPNNFLQYVMNGTNPHQWEEMDKWNKSSDVSLALGFNYDSSSISTQVAAVSNVINEYKNGLLSGQLDPSTELQNFRDALKAAGADTIVEEKQKQLDEWLAAKG